MSRGMEEKKYCPFPRHRRGIGRKPVAMTDAHTLQWYALRTPDTAAAERWLAGRGADVYIPRRTIVRGEERRAATVAVLPHVVFVRMEASAIESLEREGSSAASPLPWLRVLRLPSDRRIRPIPDSEMHLFRLLTSANADERCEVYGGTNFRQGQAVRITAGMFEGYRGHVRRIRNNRHVVVEIDGLCAIALPFIHPSLLAPIEL